MRVLLATGVAISIAACGSSSAQRPFHWTSNQQPMLGVKLDVDRDWNTAHLEDALLLTPTNHTDDFAILVVRSPDGGNILTRFGSLDRLVLKPIAAASELGTHVAELKGGTAVLNANHKVVVVRVARVSSAAPTFVAALIADGSEQRGVSAFEHVLQSMVVGGSATEATATYPPWLLKKKGPRELPSIPDSGGNEDSESEDQQQP